MQWPIGRGPQPSGGVRLAALLLVLAALLVVEVRALRVAEALLPVLKSCESYLSTKL